MLGAPIDISDGGRYEAAGDRIVWPIGPLDASEQRTLSVSAVVLDPQQADADTDPATPDDRFDLRPIVTDDLSAGADPDPSNNTASVARTVLAAPDYAASIDNAIDRVEPGQSLPYTIAVTNQGTQGGTGVQVVHRFDPETVTIVEADGGVVDVAQGTVTWSLDALDVGQVRAFDVEARVLPDASVNRSEASVVGSVSATDDQGNGADPTPLDNADEHETVLVSGPGELAAANPVPPSLLQGDGFQTGDQRTGARLPASADTAASNGPVERAFSLQQLLGDARSHALGDVHHDEDDLLNGGDLLDLFRNDVLTCEVLGIDWMRYEPTPGELGLDAVAQPPGSILPTGDAGTTPEGGTNAAEDAGAAPLPVPDSANASSSDVLPSTSKFDQQLLREFEALHGSAEPAIVGALRELQAERLAD